MNTVYAEPAEEETEVQRTRRRLREGKCPACGQRKRDVHRVCLACRVNGRDYCPNCEHVKPVAAWTRASDWCRDCRNIKRREYRGFHSPEEAKAAMLAGAARGRATVTARLHTFGAQVDALKAQGLTTWREIGEALDLPPNAVRLRYYKYQRRAKR